MHVYENHNETILNDDFYETIERFESNRVITWITGCAIHIFERYLWRIDSRNDKIAKVQKCWPRLIRRVIREINLKFALETSCYSQICVSYEYINIL